MEAQLKDITLDNSSVNKRRSIYTLALILVTAFLLRFIAGMALYSGDFTLLGGEHKRGFWDWGYFEFAELAINLAEGKGLYKVEEFHGKLWSNRPPLYPAMLAGLYILFGKNSLPPVIIQSIFGALTALFTYLIARMVFNKEAGIIASLITALYPYYIFHDTALQETAIFTLLTAVAIYLLLKSSKTKTLYSAFLAGLFLGLAALTRTIILPCLLLAIVWFIIILKGSRIKIIMAMLSGFIIVSAPWLIRNAIIHGKPVFVIHSGTALWVAHNPYTLTGYPYEHIDRMTAKAWAAIPDNEKEEYWKLNELDRDRFLKQKAVQFMKENPKTALKGALLKIYAVMGWKFSPDSGNRIKNLVYTITYLPLLLLGVIGALLARDKWKELSIIYGLFFTFIAISSVYFGHTNHRVYLDIYLIVLFSYTIMRLKDFVCEKYMKRVGGKFFVYEDCRKDIKEDGI